MIDIGMPTIDVGGFIDVRFRKLELELAVVASAATFLSVFFARFFRFLLRVFSAPTYITMPGTAKVNWCVGSWQLHP